ncbi:MAG TPA: SRPBCC domain-containing protein [Solirubrobacteraceae bacterium]|nr:SRPBCC domain-containing protein [Solirubrobacteraceae bacterium]
MIPPGEIAPLRLQRSFEASPEEVFDAWTSPDVLKRWWAPDPRWASPGCDVDLRVGGSYVLRIQGPDGPVYAVTGEYREVDRPRRLVYTWTWLGEGALHPDNVSVVTVDFVPDGDRTTVVLEHAGLASEQSRSRHDAGWAGAFDNLAGRIFGGTT